MTEEESLYICSCDADVNYSSSFTTSPSSPSSIFGNVSSEVTEIEDCALPNGPAPHLMQPPDNTCIGTQNFREPYKRTKFPIHFKNFTSSYKLSKEWVKKTHKAAYIGNARTDLERIKEIFGTPIGRLQDTSAFSPVMPMKIMGGGSIEVEVELYSPKETDHRSTNEGDKSGKLSPILDVDVSRSILKQKNDKIKRQRIIVGEHLAVKKASLPVAKMGTREKSMMGCYHDGMKTNDPQKRHGNFAEGQPFVMVNSSDQAKTLEELSKETVNPFEKIADLLMNACENHVPNPILTRTTEGGYKRKGYFACLIDDVQNRNLEEVTCFKNVLMEDPLNAKKINNPNSILNGNEQWLRSHLHPKELKNNFRSDTLDEVHFTQQKAQFTDEILTCFANPAEVLSQKCDKFPQIPQTTEPQHGELKVSSPSCGKGESMGRTKDNLREPFCKSVEVSTNPVAFLPESPIESIRILNFDSKSRATDALKVYENPTQTSERIISYENNCISEAQGWHPLVYSIPNTEKHPDEACAELLHDLCESHVIVTESQNLGDVVRTYFTGTFVPRECLRVQQPFNNVVSKSSKCPAYSFDGKVYQGCATENQFFSSSSELSGILEGGDTVRDGITELPSKKHYQRTVFSPPSAELRCFVSIKSEKSEGDPKYSFNYTSRDSDGFGDVEETSNDSGKRFGVNYHTFRDLTSSAVDDIQTSLNNKETKCVSNKTHLKHLQITRYTSVSSSYAVTVAHQPSENVEILERVLLKTERLEAVKVKKQAILPTALEVARNFSRVCQNVLTIGEALEIADPWNKELQTNSKVPPPSLVNIHPKPDIHITQIMANHVDEIIDTLHVLKSLAARESLVMFQNTFKKEESTVRNEPKMMFPESVRVIPLQELPGIVDGYRLLYRTQKKPKRKSKMRPTKRAAHIPTDAWDGLTGCVRSNASNSFPPHDHPHARDINEKMEHPKSLAYYSFEFDHLSTAKKSVQNPDSAESDIKVLWSAAPKISRRKYYYSNSVVNFDNHCPKHLTPHGKSVMLGLKKNMPFPGVIFNNPSGRGRERRKGANIHEADVQPLVLMDGKELDSVHSIAMLSNEYLQQTHNNVHMKQKEKVNRINSDTVFMSWQTKKKSTCVPSACTKQETKPACSCRNPLDLLILDTISSISEHTSFETQPSLRRGKRKGLTFIWRKKVLFK